MNNLFRILHFHRKPPQHPRKSTSQLRLRKILPYARPLPVQKGDLSVVRPRASMLIHHLIPTCICIHPPFRTEDVRVCSPELRTAVDSIWTEKDAGAAGYMRTGDSGVADGFAEGERDSGIQAEDFLDNAVEEGEGFEVGVRDG